MSVESLRDLTIRQIALLLVQKQLRWRKLTDVASSIKQLVLKLRLPARTKTRLQEAVSRLLSEVQRWADKHAEMFPALPAKNGRLPRAEHIRTFQPWLVWVAGAYEIDDCRTARAIIDNECGRWAQLRWQFACCYAMEDEILDDARFDRHRRSAFRRTLSDHPVYAFWSALYDARCRSSLFETERRPPNQTLTQCFVFAATHGFNELVRYLWRRIGPAHREYAGLLQWRALCFRCRDRNTMTFLCTKLCEVNATAVARITWCTFFDAFHKAVNNDECDKVIEKKNRLKVEFLLANCCPTLRKRLLGMENFRYNLGDLFGIFLEYLDKEDLRAAREVSSGVLFVTCHVRSSIESTTVHGQRTAMACNA